MCEIVSANDQRVILNSMELNAASTVSRSFADTSVKNCAFIYGTGTTPEADSLRNVMHATSILISYITKITHHRRIPNPHFLLGFQSMLCGGIFTLH